MIRKVTDNQKVLNLNTTLVDAMQLEKFASVYCVLQQNGPQNLDKCGIKQCCRQDKKMTSSYTRSLLHNSEIE